MLQANGRFLDTYLEGVRPGLNVVLLPLLAPVIRYVVLLAAAMPDY